MANKKYPVHSRLNQKPIEQPLILSTDEGAYAPAWDNPKTQMDRVRRQPEGSTRITPAWLPKPPRGK